MSVNDAGPSREVGKKEENTSEANFSSPNIKSASDERADDQASKEEEVRKKRETVEIDGVPISKEDIKFHSSKIESKDGKSLFVNVKGAEKRKREEERRKAEAERLAAKKLENEKRAEQKEVSQQKRSERREERRQKREQLAFNIRDNRVAIRRGIIIGIIALILVGIGAFFLIQKIIAANKEHSNEVYNEKVFQALLDSDDANNKFIEGDYAGGMAMYDDLIAKSTTDEAKAALYLQRAIAIDENFSGKTELEQAISDAYKAESMHPNSLSAETIYKLEKKNGNEEKAEEYKNIFDHRLSEEIESTQGEG